MIFAVANDHAVIKAPENSNRDFIPFVAERYKRNGTDAIHANKPIPKVKWVAERITIPAMRNQIGLILFLNIA